MGTARKVPIPFPLPEDLSGSTVGRFIVRFKLGAGGMGEVYYAEDTKLQRPVALKRVAHRLGSDPGARQHILREAQRASALNSEHIASVHDVLEECGELFLVMEYVEGETLRQRLQRPITSEQFFEIATQCAEALMAAHERSIVHCDIKPENIMLTPTGHVKILDFGVAKHLPRSDQSSTLGCSGLVAGTPAYMAPEVLLEKLPDARTDIFSLGVVLYEMLTLRHPFLRGSFIATGERILHEIPTAIRVCHPNLPEGLDSIVMKAMAKEPRQRYANAREFLEDLRRVQAGAMPSKPIPTASLWERSRIRRWFVAALVVVAMAAALLAIYRWKHSAPVLAERGWVFISDFETSGAQSVPDKAVREGLTIALQQSRYINVFPRARAYEVLQRMKKEPATRIDEALGREICQRENLRVLLTGSIEHMGQMFQITVQAFDPVQGSLLFADRVRLDREDQFFERADALAQEVRKHLGESLEHIEKSSRPLARVTTNSLEALQFYSRAKDARDQGRDDQVLGLLKSALRLDPNFAMAHLWLAQYYVAVVGKNEKALTEVERAYQLRRGLADREQRRIEAEYYKLQEQYDDEAQSLSILVSLYPDDEEAHQELADAYYELNQLDKAVLELREVLRLNSSSAPAYRRLVLFLARSNQAEAAIAASREAQQRAVDSPQMHWGLGLAYLGQGQASLAREEFHQLGHGTETDRELQELCLAVADLYEGRLDVAKAELAKHIQAAPQSGGLQTVRHYLLGRIHLTQGNSRQAKLQADFILRVPSAGLQTSDLLDAGILYARAGSINNARLVLHRIDASRKAFPSSSNKSCFHNLEGEIALAGARPAAAESSFMTASQENPEVISHTGLARAYQAQEHWDLAALEWEQVLRNKGEILQNDFPPDLASAHFQLARVYRHMNRRDLARNHYEELLRMWQHADELPLLNDAKRELQDLNLDFSKRTIGPGNTSPVARTKSKRRLSWTC